VFDLYAKSKINEIYSTLVFVDHVGNPVSGHGHGHKDWKDGNANNSRTFRTQGCDASSASSSSSSGTGTGTVSWGQEAVFEASTGLLRAAYAHIEVQGTGVHGYRGTGYRGTGIQTPAERNIIFVMYCTHTVVHM
jgi:hypothetical protein